jgi:hypothetical protein
MMNDDTCTIVDERAQTTGLLDFRVCYCAAARLRVERSKGREREMHVKRMRRENGALVAWL